MQPIEMPCFIGHRNAFWREENVSQSHILEIEISLGDFEILDSNLVIGLPLKETVKDISIRYIGHFDDDLFEEVRKLDPDLKDPDCLEDGQLIRIPLRVATPVN